MPAGSLVRPTVALGVAQLAQMAASLATLWILGAALGPSGMGELGSVVATYVLLGAVTDLGTGLVVVREMAREPGRARELAVIASRLRVGLGLVAGLVGIARYAPSGLPEASAGVVGALFPVSQGLGSARLLLQATGNAAGQVRATVLGRVAQVALVALAAWLGTGARGAVAALVGGELAVASLLRVEAGVLPAVGLEATWRGARAIAWAALPLALAFVLTQAVETLDVLLLRSLRTLDETGIYAVAERPLAILDQVPRLLLWSVFTVLAARAASGDREGLARTHRDALAALGVVAAPVAVGAWLAGPGVLRLIFDARFDAAGGPFVVLAAGSAVGFLAAPATSLLVALGHTRACVVAAGVAFATNVVLNAALIPAHGAIGAAWAWLAARVAEALVVHACVYWASGVVPPVASFGRSALAALVLGAALVKPSLEWHPLALVAAGIPVYAIAAIATGAVRVEGGRVRA